MLPAFFVERSLQTVKHFTKVLPILSIALALILDIVLPDNLQHLFHLAAGRGARRVPHLLRRVVFPPLAP